MTSQGTNHDQARRKSADHLVITVHGIRTFGMWQERLEVLLTRASDRIAVNNIDYGYFSVLAFLVPFVRWLATRRIRRILLAALQERDWKRIDIIAHSFGTHLVAWSLRGLPAQQCKHVHTIILAGSVLKPRFSWSQLIGRHVQRVVNDCGTKDWILVSSQLCVLLTGMAGRVGFRGKLGAHLRNRYFRFGHSGYFVTPGFMEQWWVPLLTTDEDAEPHDERTQNTLSSLLTWALGYAEPFKIAVYAGALVLAASAFVQPLLTLQRTKALVRLIDGSERGLEEHRHALAAQLALEAFELNETHKLKRSATVEHILRATFEASPFSHELHGPKSDAMSTAISSDGRFLLTAWEDGTVACWDLKDRNLPPRFTKLLDGRIKSLAFHPESHRFAVGAENGVVWIGDASAQDLDRERIEPCPGLLENLSFGADSYVLAAGSENRAFLWDLRGTEPPRIHKTGQGVSKAIFSPDGSWLVLGAGAEIHLKHWPGGDGEQQFSFQLENELVSAVVLSPDSSTLAVASHLTMSGALGDISRAGQGRVRLWKLDLGRPVEHPPLLEAPAQIQSLAITSEGRIVAGCADAKVRIWNLQLPLKTQVLAGHSRAIESVAASVSGNYVASAGGKDQTFRLWSTETALAAPLRLPPIGGPVDSLAFCGANGDKLAVVARGQLRLWDLQQPDDDPAILAESDWDTKGNVLSVASRPPSWLMLGTGSKSFGGTKDHSVRLLNLTAPQLEERVLGEHVFSVVAVAFDQKGTRLVSVGEENTVIVWDLRRGGSEKIGQGDLGGLPMTAAFGPSDLLAVGCENGILCLFSVSAERPVLVFRSPKQAVDAEEQAIWDVAFSPDGRWVAAAYADGRIRLWRPEEDAAPEIILDDVVERGGLKPANCLAFSPDNRTLAAGSEDGNVWLWSLSTIPETASILKGPERPVRSVAFSPDGNRLAVGFADGTVLVWPALHVIVQEGRKRLWRYLSLDP